MEGLELVVEVTGLDWSLNCCMNEYVGIVLLLLVFILLLLLLVEVLLVLLFVMLLLLLLSVVEVMGIVVSLSGSSLNS